MHREARDCGVGYIELRCIEARGMSAGRNTLKFYALKFYLNSVFVKSGIVKHFISQINTLIDK
jgi:hypothetical protein